MQLIKNIHPYMSSMDHLHTSITTAIYQRHNIAILKPTSSYTNFNRTTAILMYRLYIGTKSHGKDFIN